VAKEAAAQRRAHAARAVQRVERLPNARVSKQGVLVFMHAQQQAVAQAAQRREVRAPRRRLAAALAAALVAALVAAGAWAYRCRDIADAAQQRSARRRCGLGGRRRRGGGGREHLP